MAVSKYSICLIFLVGSIATQHFNNCLTNVEDSIECINIMQCSPLLDLLEHKRNNASVVAYLRNSTCGFDGKYPKVCCPLNLSSNSFISGNIHTNKSSPATNENNNDNTESVTVINDEFDQDNSNADNNGTDDGLRFGQPGYYSNIRRRPNRFKVTRKPAIASIRVTSERPSTLPHDTTCGKTSTIRDKIVGGSPPKLDDWPWMVALGFRDAYKPEIPLQWLCGGTLISNRYVVTAAHCTTGVGGRQITIARVGELDLNPNVKDGASPQDIPVSKIIAHELYNGERVVNDIALLKLESPVTFNAHVQPICLPSITKMKFKNFVKFSPTVIGYGSTNFRQPTSSALLEVVVPVLDNAECERAYKKTSATIDERVICAGYLQGGKDACQGDSGGPLMLPNGKQYYLIGVVSFGYKCAEPGYPGIYTRVTYFVDWIIETINKN
ncbi:venom protease-like [Adelges cooleyi]|uniref:venom protease-like n=1 Tax=Adelges cooleyi TaxID=133065 RepID=UPI002180780C|nr:venom protease-like [Adelges cooleyi]